MKLTLVSVPIGNLEDITIRSLKAIFELDVIVAEDTRNYIKLRNLLSVRFDQIIKSEKLNPQYQPQLISYREQNHDRVTPQIFAQILEGQKVGFMSDAGMPAISDPGYKLVKACILNGIEVEILPGAVAVESALVISGLPTDRYTFIGFLPRERSKIKQVIETNMHNTIVYYESPFRLIKSLEVIAELGDFNVSASNDLTKKFEQTFRGNVKEVLESLKKEKKIQGEWSLVLRLNKRLS